LVPRRLKQGIKKRPWGGSEKASGNLRVGGVVGVWGLICGTHTS